MGTVFEHFASVSYKFLRIVRGTVRGDEIISAETFEGIFKLRDGMVQGEREVATSDATLHVHPEDFGDENLVGNGILVGGKTYRIAGMTAGRNFNTGEVEHYRLTLEREDYYNVSEFE